MKAVVRIAMMEKLLQDGKEVVEESRRRSEARLARLDYYEEQLDRLDAIIASLKGEDPATLKTA